MGKPTSVGLLVGMSGIRLWVSPLTLCRVWVKSIGEWAEGLADNKSSVPELVVQDFLVVAAAEEVVTPGVEWMSTVAARMGKDTN